MNHIFIGKVVGTSGIKGYIKINTSTEYPQDMSNFLKIFDQNGQEFKISKFISSKGSVAIVQLENIFTIEEAQNLINTELFTEKSALPELNNDEFYYANLIGLKVYLENNEYVGVVINVMNYGASDIIEVETTAGELQLYPFIDEVIVAVNNTTNCLIIRQLEVL